MKHCLGKSNPLLVPFGQLADLAVRHFGKAAHLKHIVDAVCQLRAFESADFAGEFKVFVDRHIQIQRVVFRQIPDSLPYLKVVLHRIHAAHLHGAAGCGNKTRDDAHGCGLARSVGAQEAEHFAFSHFKREVSHGMNVAEILVEVFYLEHYGIVGWAHCTPP